VEYWDETYAAHSRPWDTLYGYSDIRPVLLDFCRAVGRPLGSQPRVLHAGCGTSNVAEGLWGDGAAPRRTPPPPKPLLRPRRKRHPSRHPTVSGLKRNTCFSRGARSFLRFA
ncbi:unnamed protein product, partial [Prorocentrum cordatum]